MWQELITKINATLETVTLVKDYFSTPKENLSKYPAVFFKPAGFQNNFETGQENSQTYRFLMIVIIGCNGTTAETAFGTILPKVVDAITDAFDEGWDYGTINGHRVRVKIDSADEWQVSEGKEGAEVYAPLSIEIRLVKNI